MLSTTLVTDRFLYRSQDYIHAILPALSSSFKQNSQPTTHHPSYISHPICKELISSDPTTLKPSSIQPRLRHEDKGPDDDNMAEHRKAGVTTIH